MDKATVGTATNKINSYETLPKRPWICPVCSGQGRMILKFYNIPLPEDTAVGAKYEICRSCSGAGYLIT